MVGDHPRGDGKAGGRGRGQQHQKMGHSGSRRRGGTSCANAVQIAGEGPFVSAANAVDTESSGTPGLSTEQWQTLLAMLKSQKLNASEKMIDKHNLWIIDTGASNHMTGNAENLRDVWEISSCHVTLPDGNNAVAIKEGSVVLGGDLILKDVLGCLTQNGTTNDIMGQSLLDYVVDEEFRINGDLVDRGSAEQNVANPIAQKVRPDDEGNMEEQFGRGQHRKQASVRLHDYVTNTIQKLSPIVHSPTPQHLSGVVQVNVLVYVDDLIISENNHATIQRFKSYLSECFHMKDLGALKYFLGVEVARGLEGIFLCQRKYAIDIIYEIGLLGAKPASVPLEQNHRLALATGRLIDDPERYRRLVERLIYLCFMRPELSYCVHVLSQFMQQPREEQWEAARLMVRYLKGNLGQGILLSNECNLRLYGWCDADWAGCPLTRRSLTGWIIFLGTSPILWKTKKQHTMSWSSAKAEYRSMAMTTGELLWLKGILRSFGVSHNFAMHLSCDSHAALHIAKNPVFHERTKHIEVDCHFVRDEIIKDNIHPQFVPSHAQLADIFTKALGESQFDHFTRKLGIRNLHAPT
ncbi:hypothetical protein RJ639_029744 [Escallonia herrerae]|uniref:Reverse transcriptase Ty1/copia-type domain-containing protein n=1 Tax=Escallonia herrerae TaxID=1293975 RepID=A0AA89BB26_9ASTE|nr:hypothetical protein RJ639_029744 [Escallonia herrerae]